MALSVGGYDHSFVYSLHDRFICRICHLPSREPYLTDCCGATFCKSCLEEFARHATTASISCPTCRQEQFGSMINKQIDREIRSLHIYCTNKEKGCEWQGELNDISNHLRNSDGCQFEELKCRSNECGKVIQRQYQTSHIETECPHRQVNCQYCHDIGEHRFIEGQHKEECPKLPLPCPNKCEVGSILREDMEAHRKECPLEMIQCEYYSVGCKRVKLTRKDMKNHNKENVEEHLIMTNDVLTDTKAQIAELTYAKSQLAAELTDTKSQLVDVIDSKTKLAAELIDTKEQLNATLKQNTAALKHATSLTAILMNAQLDPNTAANIRSVPSDRNCGNQTCPVTIKMSEYNMKREDKIQWFSDPFYTHNKGYKMRLRVDAAGNMDGKGTHLSVFLNLMKGPHDDELTWPLKGKFEIKLFNQISDSEHYCMILHYYDEENEGCRVTEDSNWGWGHRQYITNKLLNKITPIRQYLKDDCLFFQVTKF